MQRQIVHSKNAYCDIQSCRIAHVFDLETIVNLVLNIDFSDKLGLVVAYVKL